MSKILLAGYYGFGNLGDEALAGTAARILHAKHQVVVLRRRARFWPLLCWSDCLLFGGGSLFQDATGRGLSLLYYAFWGFAAKLLGKKLFLVAQCFGPVRRPLNRLILRWLLRRADFISVRDSASAEFLTALGCQNFSTVPDLLFAADLKIKPQISKKILVNLRPLPNFQPEQGKQILAGFAPLYLDMQPGVDPGLPASENLALLAGARLAVGMRLHFLLLAVLWYVPAIGLAYDPKVAIFCRRFGLPYVELDNLSVLPDLIARELRQASRTRIRLRRLVDRERRLAQKSTAALLEALHG